MTRRFCLPGLAKASFNELKMERKMSFKNEITFATLSRCCYDDDDDDGVRSRKIFFFLLACHTTGLSTTIQVPLRGKRVVYCCFVILWSLSMASPFISNGELWGQMITFSTSTIKIEENLGWVWTLNVKLFYVSSWQGHPPAGRILGIKMLYNFRISVTLNLQSVDSDASISIGASLIMLLGVAEQSMVYVL